MDRTDTITSVISIGAIALLAGVALYQHDWNAQGGFKNCDSNFCTYEQHQTWSTHAQELNFVSAKAELKNELALAPLRAAKALLDQAQAKAQAKADAELAEIKAQSDAKINALYEGSIKDKSLLKGWKPEMNGNWSASGWSVTTVSDSTVTVDQSAACPIGYHATTSTNQSVWCASN